MIQDIKNDRIYYFDLNYSIPEIKKYYEDKFNNNYTDNHYLILYQMKFNIIEKETKLTPDILDNLVKIPTDNNIKCYYNDNTNGETLFTSKYKKPLKTRIDKNNGMYILTTN